MNQASLFDIKKVSKAEFHQLVEITEPTPASTIAQTLQAYHTHFAGGKYSVYTAGDFTGDIKKLSTYLRSKTVSNITLFDLQDWISILSSSTGENLSAKTVSRKIAAVKNYFQWLMEIGVLHANPASSLITSRITSPLPDVLYEEECQKLLKEASSDARAYLLIMILLETGIKKEEIFSLKIDHFDFSDKYKPVLWVKHEGKKVVKDRKVKLSAEIRPVFYDYLSLYNITDLLFPYTHRTIELTLKETAEKAGIKKKVTAQILRDTFIVRELNRGKSMSDVLTKAGLNPSTWEDAETKYGKLAAPAL